MFVRVGAEDRLDPNRWMNKALRKEKSCVYIRASHVTVVLNSIETNNEFDRD